MSRGHFNYTQYQINDIIDTIEEDLKMEPTGWGEAYLSDAKPETIQEIERGLRFLKLAHIYAQRIDWFMSGDDCEESFHRRLKEDLLEADLI